MALPTKTDIGVSLITLIEKIFRLTTNTTSTEQALNDAFVLEYQRADGMPNLRKQAAIKIANIVSYDSDLEIDGTSEMAKYLQELLGDWMSIELQKLSSRTIGTGGIILKPVTDGGKVSIDVLYQNQLIDYDMSGNKLTRASFIADTVTKKDVLYLRIETHTLNDNNYIIENKAVRADYSDKEVPLTSIDKWADIPPIQPMENIENMLFGMITCPTDAGMEYNNPYGVPVDYGQDYLKAEILKMLETLAKEFKLKKPRVGFDSRLQKTDDNGNIKFEDDQIAELFINALPNERGNMFDYYAPPYQEQSIINAVEYLFRLLENGMTVSSGIFTKLQSNGATATEIKQAMFDTLCYVMACRNQILKGFKQLSYACSVYGNINKKVPMGEYTIRENWSYALFESSAETWQQFKEGISLGTMNLWEVRAWQTGESEEKAKKNLPDIVVEEV